MDQSLWQTLITFDLKHSSHMRIQTMLSCGKYSPTMQMKIVSGFWICWRSGRLKINIRWTLVHFRKTHVRAHKLDVQETNFSFTQFYISWNNFSRCRFTHGWIPALDLWVLVVEVFHSSLNQLKKPKDREQGNLLRDTPSNKHTQNQAKLCFVDWEVFSIRCDALHFEDNEAVIKMIIKGRSPTMRQVSRTHKLLLTGCLTESFLIQRFKN